MNQYAYLYPPLCVAARKGYVEMAELLISLGAKVNFKVPNCSVCWFECPHCM